MVGLTQAQGTVLDDEDFRPRLGRMRTSKPAKARRYLGLVVAATARAGQARRGLRPFTGERIGRGVAVGRLLAARDRFGPLRSRRAVVKARLVRLAGTGLAGARAHLRYIQRDGVTRDGAPGRLYSAGLDDADGAAFLARSEGDRHQFRFIVSAEDGAEYEDLKPLVRRVMAKMAADLGTGLDWVAVDHLDTLHPHTHILLRGRDDRGADLVIARDYIASGLRARVAEQVSLDLGPRSDLEIRDRLRREVGAERLTALDRRLLRDMDEDRCLAAAGRDMSDHALRAGRLQTLARMGLAETLGGGRWRLAGTIEATLREMGERGDIVRTLQRALGRRGRARGAGEPVLHRGGWREGSTLVGRVVARGLSDELRDRHYLLIDATDGRIHYVDVGRGDALEPIDDGAIVRLSAREAVVRSADRTVAAVAAAHGGRYSEALHLRHDPSAAPDFVRAHVRRLEAIRKAVGKPERDPAGDWTIGPGHLDRAAAYEKERARQRPVRVELLSSLRLEALVEAEGATWLDRELVADRPEPLRAARFGAEVASASAARRAWLVRQGLAEDEAGGFRYRRDLLATLRQRELRQVGGRLADEHAMPARLAEAGERVSGVLRRRLDLASGRFGLIEGAGELLLVPWRPELERRLGRALSGRVGPSGFSWSRGRGRGLDIG